MLEQLDECLLCGGKRLRPDTYATQILNLAEEHGVSVCLDCSFRFLNPRPSFEEYRQAYTHGVGPIVETYGFDKDLYGREDAGRIFQYRKKLDLLIKHGSRGRLLEIGSCKGIFLNEAKNKGFEVEGIEPSKRDSKEANRCYGLNLHVGGVEDFNFPEESFDVVCSSHVFEHLMDPLTVAKKISGWLRPGGIHLIEVPNWFGTFEFRRWRFIRRNCPKSRDFFSIHHVSFFTPKTLRKLIKLSGCRLVNFRNVYHSPMKPSICLKSIVSSFFALFFGALNIEVLAQKT